MEATMPHCVAAAEILRLQLGADIVMTIFDRKAVFDKALENYEVYDHQSLFQFSKRIVPIESAGNGGPAAAKDPDVSLDSGPQASRRIKPFGAGNNWALAVYMMRRSPYWAWYLFRRTRSGQSMWRLLYPSFRGSRIRRFLRVIKPDIIILTEDNVERLSTTIINEARRQGIPSIIIPFTIPNPLEPAKSYRDQRLHQVRRPLSRLMAALYPKWKFRLDGKDLLRLPALTVLILEMLGQSSPAPWILNRGGAARIALDSEAQRDVYLKWGFPPSQLSVVGDINSEILNQGLINRPRLLGDLLGKNGFQPGRPLILCGFPPDQFGSKNEDFEFQNYDELVEAWIESFRALGDRANVLIRPHPRADRRLFEAQNGSNVRITWQPTAELIPLCDLYVASISATIRWAISCGVPVINYDTYRYRYGDYDKAPGVLQTESLSDFRTLLARFVSDPSFATDLAERQRSGMQYWGTVNSKLPQRFAALVSEVIDANDQARSIS
jgi:hypothetical protein